VRVELPRPGLRRLARRLSVADDALASRAAWFAGEPNPVRCHGATEVARAASATKGGTHAEVPHPASYTGDGVQGLRQEGGSARRAVVEKACSSVGGKLDAFYYAFGETDVVTIMDLPDNVTAAGVALLVAAGGKVDIKTTVLLTPQEVDAGVKVTGDYRPPGG